MSPAASQPDLVRTGCRSQHPQRYTRRKSRAGSSGSGRVASGAGAAHGFIDDMLGHLSQFAVVGLADCAQLSERLLCAAPAASPDQADRLIDHRARRQRRLQLCGQRRRVGEDLGVMHRHRCGFGEEFPQFGGVLIEDVFAGA